MSSGEDRIAIVYATFPSVEEAERIGGVLVERGLAACVNILPAMVSIYVWKGQMHRDAEVAMLFKTRASLAQRLIAEGARLHPYDNPAFVVLPVEQGAAPFLDWIRVQTADPR